MFHSMCKFNLTGLAPLLLAMGLVFSATAFSPPSASAAESKRSPIDLAAYGKLLDAHTKSTQDLVGTRVDYRALKNVKELKGLIRQIKQAKPSTLDRDEKLAFWINAYNVLAIDLVVQNYPLDSIKDIGSFFSPVWDIEVATIEGRAVSLGAIEHEILRQMGEPRIHAAIICASVSCPPLARTPFSPATIDADLDAAMQSWLASNEKGIAIDRSARSVRLSKIFDWFEEDFEAKGGVLKAIAPHLSEADGVWLAKNGKDATIRYFGYDWSLNEVVRGR